MRSKKGKQTKAKTDDPFVENGEPYFGLSRHYYHGRRENGYVVALQSLTGAARYVVAVKSFEGYEKHCGTATSFGRDGIHQMVAYVVDGKVDRTWFTFADWKDPFVTRNVQGLSEEWIGGRVTGLFPHQKRLFVTMLDDNNNLRTAVVDPDVPKVYWPNGQRGYPYTSEPKLVKDGVLLLAEAPADGIHVMNRDGVAQSVVVTRPGYITTTFDVDHGANDTAYGGSPGETPVTYFLRNAKQSAFEATDAVKVAFEGLQAIKRDEAEMLAAEARSAFVATAESQRLCGSASPCDTSTTQTPVYDSSSKLTEAECETAEAAALPLFQPENETATARADRIARAKNIVDKRLTCITQEALAPYRTVIVSSVVVPYLNQEAQPTFANYAGGALQKSFIEQWAAVRQVRLTAEALKSQVDAAVAKMGVAFTSTITAQSQIDFCAKKMEGAGAEADQARADFLLAQKTEWETCLTLMCTPWDIKCFGDLKLHESGLKDHDVELLRAIGCKAKPEVWQGYFSARAACAQAKQATAAAERRCELAGIAMDIGKAECKVFDSAREESHARANSDFADAIASLTSQRSELAKVGEKLALAVATQEQLKNEAELSTMRQQLEVSLTVLGQQTSFSLWRSLHHYDSWRARALLDGARRYAVAARRAIEARYLVDLSTMKDNEPFVAAPYLWADDIYRYDLSLPAAVGLSIAPNDSSAVYANQVLDYVGNLEKFVSGFAVQRPASAALRDGEVLSFPGPRALWEDVTREHAGVSWMVHCGRAAGFTATLCNGVQTQWCAPSTAVSLDDVCQATGANGSSSSYGPDRARIVFELDPWGRFGGTSTLEPLQNRVNARWDRLALNLVGAGIRDCSVADDHQACWSQPFLRYSLSHRGPVSGISYDGRRMTLDIPTANIEGGKALAVDELLDPVLNGWGKPYVEAIARMELLERPLGGSYELEFELPEGTSLDSIERVQLLLTSNYWSLQTQ